VVSESSSAHSEGILSHAGGGLSQWVDVAFLSGVPEFLLMSVRISHFQLRSMEAILAE
jgi:hypothetical protein